jgi:protein-S-isoprenylcysteine O-methyltransferase Ste14
MFGLLLSILLHFLSVEHAKLESRFGTDLGILLGKILGGLSGWMGLLLLIGLWVSPQPRFSIGDPSILLLGESLPVSHLLVSLPLLAAASWISLRAVVEMERKVGWGVVDMHARPPDVVTTGPYSSVRNPQYLGACLAHLGGALLFSATYAMLFTPCYILINYALSWKEEKELVQELGDAYLEYRTRVPMFFPRRRP